MRELRNLLERACLLCDGDEIDLRHLPSAGEHGLAQVQGGRPERPALNDQSLLEYSRSFTGNRKDLARQLGLSERTLYRRLKALEG